MYAVMHEAPERVDLGEYPLKTRAEVGQVLLPLAQDDTGMLDRVRTRDGTRTQVSFLVTDQGSTGWRMLRADLKRYVHLMQSDPAIAGQYEIIITGSSSLAQEAMAHVVWDLVSSLSLAFVAIFIIMTILFRSVRIGFISMVPNLLPLVMTLGLMGVLGITLRMSTAVIFSVSLGIAVDDTIHYVHRVTREASEETAEPWVAIGRSHESVGRAMVYTTLTIALGFSILVLSNFVPTAYFGSLTGLAMATALAADLTLLPLLIVRFGPPGLRAAASARPTRSDPEGEPR